MQEASSRLTQNNFHLIRLVCALVVCTYHSYELSRFPSLAWMPRIFSPNIALNSFFIISGFLISLSYERTEGVVLFFKKRFFRIYPAYFLVVVGVAVLGFLLSTESFSAYFSRKWWMYLVANLLLLNFLNPTLPGVFGGNRLPDVNGSLWTIKVEAFLYATVPLLALVTRKVSPKAVSLAAYAVVTALDLLLNKASEITQSPIIYHLSREITNPLSYFTGGALIYQYLNVFERYGRVFVIVGIFCMCLNEFWSLAVFAPLSLAVVVIFCSLFGFMGNFARFGDLSYGVYILHFPIIQVLLQYRCLETHPYGFLATVLCASLVGAKMLWHAIELPCLERLHRSRTLARSIR